MAYSWTAEQVFSLLGIRTAPGTSTEKYVHCPFCNSSKKKFAMNMQKGTGHCFICDVGADTAKYYAAVEGMSEAEARRDIERRLNIKDYRIEYRPDREVTVATNQAEMASIKDLDYTYRHFLDELTLSEKNYNSLLARGFEPSDIQALGYKTFPNRSEINFYDLCRRLIKAGCTLKGVPGFFQTKTGDWTFVSITKGIILPQKTVNNMIFGFQIRKDNDLLTYNEETGELEPKCVWFSSKNCRNGCGSRADINFSCDFIFDQKTMKSWPYFSKKKVILTEGSLKADLIHCFEPSFPVISVAGVNSTTYLEKTLSYLKKLGVEAVLHAYDMDYQTNKSVSLQLEKTRDIIKNAGMNYTMLEWDTSVEANGQKQELLKGLDDYLAYLKKGIIPKLKSPMDN